ncbi:MAG: hypothetical protein ACRC0G_14910 [Fusobacteriaceae bacterium]
MDLEKLKENMGSIINGQLKLVAEQYYEEGVKDGIAKEKKRAKKEAEDSVIMVDGNTYIDLEYEVRTSKHSVGMDLNSVKQHYYERECLVRDCNGKYSPMIGCDVFVLHQGKLYINKDEVTILNHVYNIQRMITKDIYDIVKYQLDTNFGGMVVDLKGMLSIENKQKNPMFRNIKKGDR